eukprot:8220365-Prorocentrum_lima.AAC.1
MADIQLLFICRNCDRHTRNIVCLSLDGPPISKPCGAPSTSGGNVTKSKSLWLSASFSVVAEILD